MKLFDFHKTHYEDEIREVLHANEVRANRLTATALFLSVGIIALIWVLNMVNIFATPHSIMNRLFIVSVIALVIPCTLYLIVKGDRPWLKFVMLVFLTFVCAFTNAVLSFNSILVMAVPICVSTRYYSKRLTTGMAIFTVVLFFFATVWNVKHYGSVSMDFNYYPKPPAGTVITFSEALDFKDNILAGGVDAGRWMYNSIVLGYIPRVLVYLICAFVCVRVSSEGSRLVYEQALVSQASASARKELDLATEIQEGMLPSIFPAYPSRSEFDIYAMMHPAREVGGDFYDFFLIDDDHLGIVMADVSGKGVPAALFMMASKILISNFASLGDGSPAHVLERVNHQTCLNNPAEMFVTVWLGILEISTGRLRAANAGHEYPAVCRAGGSFELYEDKHGFVIGGMDGMRYKEYEIMLEPGDALYLYTDGVAEATNAKNELFGTERMLASLNRKPDASTDELLRNVREDIDSFVAEAPQFDDITMLCLRYIGSGAQKLTIEADTAKLPDVLAFVDGILESAGCSPKAQMQIDVAVEEIFVNIAHYAYENGSGSVIIGITMSEDPAAASITFADNGIPYDPLSHEDPDISLSAEQREIGGLGILMVRKTMDDVRYEYKDGQNLLTLVKNL